MWEVILRPRHFSRVSWRGQRSVKGKLVWIRSQLFDFPNCWRSSGGTDNGSKTMSVARRVRTASAKVSKNQTMSALGNDRKARNSSSDNSQLRRQPELATSVRTDAAA